MSDRGFGRIIAAVKGLDRFASWLESTSPATLPAASSPATSCKREQVAGWRCVAQGDHTECLLERVP